MCLLPDGWDEHAADDDEIEDVPAVAEEVPWPAAVRGNAKDELDNEDAKAQFVHRDEHAAEIGHGRRIGLGAQHECVEDDDARDKGLEAVAVDEPG